MERLFFPALKELTSQKWIVEQIEEIKHTSLNQGFVLKFPVDLTSRAGSRSIDRGADKHTTDAGSIPRRGKGLFSQIQLSLKTLTVSGTTVFNRMHQHLCAL